MTSTYLLNRLPSPVLGNVSPYEKLVHKPPSYENLRSFGCLAYMSQHSSDKLLPRALKTVFVGYLLHKKGYKLYDLESKTIHFSRNFVFFEDVYPFSTITSHSDNLLTITPTDLCHGLITPLDNL